MKLQNLIHISIGIVCIGLLPKAQAVIPAPDGGYPGGNTAEGQSALLSLTTGGYNTAVGFFSLRSNTTSSFNTAIGAGTLLVNTADGNTATGAGALLSNSTGTSNTANGLRALVSNTTGGGNAAYGAGALQSNTTALSNTAIGNGALLFNASGNSNTALGNGAGTGVMTANNVICIGFGVGGADVSNTCFIGNIHGVQTNNPAIPVLVDANNQLGTVSSSRRYKKEIKPMDKASQAILALKPVTFHYKNDKTGTPQFGLIAEDVSAVNPDLVVRDKNGEIYTVRYDAVNAMLLNEFLKEHKKVKEQQSTITQLKNDFQTVSTQQRKEIQLLSAQLGQQAAQIRMVSDQLAAASPSGGGLNVRKFATGRIRRGGTAPQIVLNNQ